MGITKKEKWEKQLVPFDPKERPLIGNKQLCGPYLKDPETGETYFGLYLKDYETNSIRWLIKPSHLKKKQVISKRVPRITPKTPRLR